VRAEHDALKADTGRLYGLVNELIIPHFDFEAASRLVLGRHWRTASDEQRARFTEAFKQLLVRTYANALFQYADETIVFKPSQTDGEHVVVKTEVTQQGAHPIPVNYRMHQKNGEWKAYDVFVDGISLVVTYRGDFGSRVNQSGIDGLISDLEAKNKGLNR
ncbi:MAG: ABC transporter substrate-binding protein, partial [Gammaproteobacteria bacterium]|nr:ABC transporter substrate-binding protein [Gammaproteobacteria bacterium]